MTDELNFMVQKYISELIYFPDGSFDCFCFCSFDDGESGGGGGVVYAVAREQNKKREMMMMKKP